jgi:hypothetical protein
VVLKAVFKHSNHWKETFLQERTLNLVAEINGEMTKNIGSTLEAL